MVGLWVEHSVAQTVVRMADNWVGMTVAMWVVAKAAALAVQMGARLAGKMAD